MGSDEWRAIIRAEIAGELGGDPTASAYLAAASRLFIRVTQRTATYWDMFRQAAASDPAIAADWTAIGLDRRQTMAEVAANIPARGLRSDLTRTTSPTRCGRWRAPTCTFSFALRAAGMRTRSKPGSSARSIAPCA